MNRYPKLQCCLLWMIAAALVLACKSGEPLAPTDADLCGQSRKPSKEDMAFFSTFTGETFTSEEWIKSDSVNDLRASATWIYEDEGGVAFAEYLLYNCGCTQSDVEHYLNGLNSENVTFNGYQNIQVVKQCTLGNEALTLYEFSVTWKNEAYSLRYWAKLQSQTRILTMMLAFPESSTSLMDQYAMNIFPELPDCQE